MDDISLSFVITTIGRKSVHRMLQSVTSQMHPQDHVFVLGDFQNPTVRHELKVVDPRVIVMHVRAGNNWGNYERNVALELVTRGTHIVFGDDDDAFTTGAVDMMHAAIAQDPSVPHMFKMVSETGVVLWLNPRVQQGNHGTPMFVAPNVKRKLGRYSDRYEGDFDFVVDTMKHYDRIVWRNEVIYACRHFGNLPGTDWMKGLTS